MREMTDAEVFGRPGRPPQMGGTTREKVIAAARRHGVPEDLALEVAHKESRFNQAAVSPKGARGVMQLMPGTAADLGVDPNNEDQNIDGGVRYIGQQMKDFGGDRRLAMAAYNAGPGNVRKYGGVPPFAETQAYVGGAQGNAPQAGVEMTDAEVFGTPKPPPRPGQPGAVPVPQLGPGVTMDLAGQPPMPQRGPVSQRLGFEKGAASVGANATRFAVALAGRAGYEPADWVRTVSDRLKGAQREVEAQHPEVYAATPGKTGRFLGEVAMTAGLPGGPLTSGGLTGALLSDGQTPWEVAKDTAVGALGGKLGSSIIGGLGRTISGVTDAGVRRLADKGVPLTLGQMSGEGLGGRMVRGLEDRLSGLPIVGDVVNAARERSLHGGVKAAYADTLKQIGEKLPNGTHLGEDAYNYTKGVLSEKYDEILGPLVVKRDTPFVTAMANIRKEISKIGDPAIRKGVDDILDVEMYSRFSKKGVMNGDGIKAVQEALRLHAEDLSKGTKWSRDAAVSVRSARTALEDLAGRINPKAGEALRSVNRAYSMFKPIEVATSKANKTEGVFNPSQLMQGVTLGKGKAAVAGGKVPQQQLARDMTRILPSRVPDSGSAGRLVLPGMAALAASLSTVNPVFAASVAGLAGVAGLYSRTGQKLLTKVLTARPEVARIAGQNVRRLGAPAGATVGAVLSSSAVGRDNKKRP